MPHLDLGRAPYVTGLNILPRYPLMAKCCIMPDLGFGYIKLPFHTCIGEEVGDTERDSKVAGGPVDGLLLGDGAQDVGQVLDVTVRVIREVA